MGDLARILTQATNDFLSSIIPDSPEPNQPWIGGLQVLGPEPAGGWRWTPDFTLNIFDVFNNFNSGEPNNLGGDENCLQMRSDHNGQWNDETCSHLFPYICVRPATATGA